MLGLGNSLTSASYVGVFSQKYSLDFDGSNDYVDVGAAYNGVKSISFFLKVDDVTSNTDYILGLNDTDYVSVVDGTVTLNGFSGGTNTIYVDASEASTVDTSWHHILITSTTARNASNCDLGRTQSNNSYNMLGNLDEVALTSDVKSASDFADGTTPLDISGLSNLQNWWRMGDGKLDSYSLICDEVTPTLGSDVAVNGDLSSNPFAHATNYSGGWSDTSIGSSEATWSSGNQTISCVGDDSGSNRGNATARVTAVSGKVYKVTFTNSTTPVNAALRISNVNSWASGTYLNVTPSSSQEFYFRSGVSGYVYITFSVFDTTTWTFGNLKVELVNGNAGIMTNMASGDIVEDTP